MRRWQSEVMSLGANLNGHTFSSLKLFRQALPLVKHLNNSQGTGLQARLSRAVFHSGGTPVSWRGLDAESLARRYSRVLQHLPSDFGLIVAVSSEDRCRLYRKWAAGDIARPFTQDTFQPYRVKVPIQQVNLSNGDLQ